MKLVDILARELRAWPKGFGKSVGQCHHGAIHSCRLPYLQSGQKFTRCDNYMTDVVSRAQWQAAVDALKAEKVFEWNGDGLPPVGTVCAVLNSNLGNATWERCTIIYSGKHRVMYDSESCEERVAFIEDLKFRTARTVQTPERIAAEERNNAIATMMQKIVTATPHDCALLYDAGYRKFEIVDN